MATITDGDSAPVSKYITLISGDGFEYVVLRDAAMISPTIKGMLRGQFTEAITARCTFPEIRSLIMEKVIEYLQFAYKHRDNQDPPEMEIPVEHCLELLVVADYFGLDKQY